MHLPIKVKIKPLDLLSKYLSICCSHLPYYFYVVADNLSCSSLLIVWTTLPMTNVYRGIRLPRKEFRGQLVRWFVFREMTRYLHWDRNIIISIIQPCSHFFLRIIAGNLRSFAVNHLESGYIYPDAFNIARYYFYQLNHADKVVSRTNNFMGKIWLCKKDHYMPDKLVSPKSHIHQWNTLDGHLAFQLCQCIEKFLEQVGDIM